MFQWLRLAIQQGRHDITALRGFLIADTPDVQKPDNAIIDMLFNQAEQMLDCIEQKIPTKLSKQLVRIEQCKRHSEPDGFKQTIISTIQYAQTENGTYDFEMLPVRKQEQLLMVTVIYNQLKELRQ